MGTKHVMNTDPTPHAGGDTTRQCEPPGDADACGDSRPEAVLEQEDHMPEESGYGYGV
jgi:hypothetical protein